MPNLILDDDHHAELAAALASGRWVVACLCAAWCDSCRAYQGAFAALAERHPEQHFVWIDIEDQADLVGDLDVENFPTLLIQQADLVAFFGAIQPEPRVAERLIAAQVEKTPAELRQEIHGNAERQRWQDECDLRRRLREAVDGARG